MMEKRRLTYFLSDFHLGARYFDSPLDNERRVVAFLDSIKDSAKEIYLLGDILDYWYEYRYVVPRGFTRFFGKIAELSDLGVKIYWFIGNHDIWIFDYLPSELGITVVDGPMVKDISGKRFSLTMATRSGSANYRSASCGRCSATKCVRNSTLLSIHVGPSRLPLVGRAEAVLRTLSRNISARVKSVLKNLPSTMTMADISTSSFSDTATSCSTSDSTTAANW